MTRPQSLLAVLSVAVALSSVAAVASEPAAWSPKFYVYCLQMGVKGVQQPTPPQQAQLFRELGYDGGGFLMWYEADLEQNLKALDDAGQGVYLLQVNLNVAPQKPVYDPRLPAAIRALKGRPVTLCVTINGLKAADPAGMEPAVKALRELGDCAQAAGIRVSVYQHVNCWAESMHFIFDLVRTVNHPCVGANFNVCHWLKVHGNEDYAPLLKQNAAKLFCVTICGAQRDAKAWTNGLIQPLDRGDFDNGQLMRVLREIGYRGPIGVMCYGIPDEPRDQLTRSLKMLKSWFPQ